MDSIIRRNQQFIHFRIMFGMDGKNLTEAAECIIKKGKKQAASYIQKFCFTRTNPDVINEVLDAILNPKTAINDWDAIDWCRWLLAGGSTPEEFAQTVRRYDNATTCGLVWTANFVAYRCRTCGISPCMSLCSDCFQRGNHEGHDFNMFRSQAGGACDCGDKSVMRESGFCQRHGSQNQMNKPAAPPNLLCVAEVVMPRLFLRLVQHFRDKSGPLRYNGAVNMTRCSVMPMADGLLSLLHNHCEMGAAMRKIMTQALTTSELYFKLAVDFDTSIPGSMESVQSLNKYLEGRNAFENSDDSMNITASSQPSASEIEFLKQSSFLDELVFWTVEFEFPQKLVCLLLNMMPDLDYKVAFAKIFVKHYDRISRMLAKSTDSDTLSNRVVHVSVQLFSNEDLAYQMTKDYDLLRIMIKSLYSMMKKISQNSVLQSTNEHQVVDCSHRIMKEHCYWPLVSDLNNVLTHQAVAFEFLSDASLLRLWFEFLSLFQGMNVNEREMKDHVEFESNTYFAAFAAELEASATPMWALISHLKSPETVDKTKQILNICKEAVMAWFKTIGFSLDDAINPYQISFHIPLHRCYASFLGQAIRQQGATLDILLPSEDELKLMMMHPMQAQVAFHEILCNLWVRSGLQIKGQAMTYIQCHFCNSIVDADLFLLQLCAMKLDPDWFIKTVFEKFHVWEWFTFHPKRPSPYMEYDKLLPMLEGALSFLCTLLSIHTNIGQTEEEVTRQEMVSLLCMSDRTHSQLLDLLPDKCGAISQNKDFESILKQVADYKAPNFEAGGTMLQGKFIPRGQIWEEEFDPIHVLLRAVHRREYQSSLDRYAQYLRQSNKFSSSRPPWPPYRIPGLVHQQFIDPRRILHSKILHGLIFIILHRAMNEPDIPEQILSLCVFLLDMAVRFPYNGEPPEPVTEQKEKETVEDMQYAGWFDSYDICQNISKVIPRVRVTEKILMSMGLVEAMEVDEDIEEDVEMATEACETNNAIVEEFQDDHDPLLVRICLSEYQSALPPSIQLALPSSTSNSLGNDFQLVSSFQASGGEVIPFQPIPSTSASSSTSRSSTSSNSSSSNSYNMALIPTSEGLTTVRPKCMKMKLIPGCHRMLLSDKGLPLELIPEGTSPDRKYMAFSSKRTLTVNESILSLLIQLHSKLSEKPDSYQPKSKTGTVLEESRIGDGVIFIERLLDYISSISYEKVKEIQSIRERLWPKKDDTSGSPSMENVDKEERRRRAKERQQKLMAEFASKQRAFMQKTLEAENTEGASGIDESMLNKEKEYECVICGQMTASEEDRPVGMVVLLQATSVIGHSHQYPDRKLPCNDDERLELQKGMNLSAAEENRVEFLTQEFNNRQWPMAVNIGWQGGVLVQSCGHYLHIDCHKSYVQSLKSQNQVSSRLQNLDVDHGEYSCPLCRQLANSVIPLNPNYGKNSALVHSHSQQWEDVALDLLEMMATPLSEKFHHICGPGFIYERVSLNQAEGIVHKLQWTLERYKHQFEKFYFNLQDKFSSFFVNNLNDIYLQSFFRGKRESNLLKKYMGVIMEDITNATFPQYRSLCAPNSSSLFLFVCSISRTNLEVELVQRGGNLLKPKKKKTCFVPLMHVLSMHSRLLLPMAWVPSDSVVSNHMHHYKGLGRVKGASKLNSSVIPPVPNEVWSRLTGILPTNEYSLAIQNDEVPLLLRDCIALLLQIALTLPLNIDKVYYTCVVQVLYNLLYIQGLVQISYFMKSADITLWKDIAQKRLQDSENQEELNDLEVLLYYVIKNFQDSCLYLEDDEMCEPCPVEKWDNSSLEQFMVDHCMHYLRIASLLQSHLYEEDIPQIKDEESEFSHLCHYLSLTTIPSTQMRTSSCIRWIIPDAKFLVNLWCKDLIPLLKKSIIAARGLIVNHNKWHPPALLKLPYNYDDIFKYYHKRRCSVCHTDPKDPSLCLVCGTLVCLRESCCRQSLIGSPFEAVAHSVSCGAGTAIYLAVNSSTIIVIRGKRACLWGSVYLDSFGEEDRDLKRGKPLFLSEARYNLLQQQWIDHSFDHTNKRWVWHKDNL